MTGGGRLPIWKMLQRKRTVMTFNLAWEDMSNFVVHFTRWGPQPRTPYNNIMSILGSGRIEARNPFGMVRSAAPDPDSQKTVCFSEIPLHHLSRLTDRRGPYGVGFTKEFMVARGGGPVFYAYSETPHSQALRDLLEDARTWTNPAGSPIWRVAPFVEFPGIHSGRSYRFEWEREWRHVGNFDFRPADVAFLVIPEDKHKDARRFFEEARDDNTGPAYLCPYIDPGWDRTRVQRALGM
jgi:hypothetical protein